MFWDVIDKSNPMKLASQKEVAVGMNHTSSQPAPDSLMKLGEQAISAGNPVHSLTFPQLYLEDSSRKRLTDFAWQLFY